MIYIGKYKELNPGKDFPSMREYMCEEPYVGQEIVARYLRTATVDMVRVAIPKDVFTGETINMEMLGMNDGEYTWFNTLAYYVEKYNLRLPKDFEDKVLKKEIF